MPNAACTAKQTRRPSSSRSLALSLSHSHPRVSVHTLLCSCVSQFGAEFRRFSLDRSKPGRFDEFYGLLQHVHRIPNVELLVGYADVHGDLLPINNDDNYHKAITTASPLLRLFLQRKGEKLSPSHVGGPAPSASPSPSPTLLPTPRLSSVCSIARVYFSL